MAQASIYTRALGRKVARNGRLSGQRKYHIISLRSDKWAVVSDGRLTPIKSFSSQGDAINFARQKASIHAYKKVVIHARDGRTAKTELIN